jgi:hypothetical protein
VEGILMIQIPGGTTQEFPLPQTVDGRPFVPDIDHFVQSNGYRCQVVGVAWDFEEMQVVVIANLILKD